MRTAFMIAAALAVAVLPARAQERSGRDLAASCAMCHGTDGRGAGGYEPLAGMPKQEIMRKVSEFRSGTKPSTVMQQIAKGYTDAEVERIAAYFAAQKK